MMDNVLIHSKTQEEHDKRLDAVLQLMMEAGVTVHTRQTVHLVVWSLQTTGGTRQELCHMYPTEE